MLRGKIAAVVAAIEDGRYSPALGARRAALEEEQASLQASIDPEPAPALRLHPGIAEIYAAKVANLEVALNDPAIRAEANELLRGLVERVELTPKPDGVGVDAILYGDLARIFAICAEADTKKTPRGFGRGASTIGGCGGWI